MSEIEALRRQLAALRTECEKYKAENGRLRSLCHRIASTASAGLDCAAPLRDVDADGGDAAAACGRGSPSASDGDFGPVRGPSPVLFESGAAASEATRRALLERTASPPPATSSTARDGTARLPPTAAAAGGAFVPVGGAAPPASSSATSTASAAPSSSANASTSSSSSSSSRRKKKGSKIFDSDGAHRTHRRSSSSSSSAAAAVSGHAADSDDAPPPSAPSSAESFIAKTLSSVGIDTSRLPKSPPLAIRREPRSTISEGVSAPEIFRSSGKSSRASASSTAIPRPSDSMDGAHADAKAESKGNRASASCEELGKLVKKSAKPRRSKSKSPKGSRRARAAKLKSEWSSTMSCANAIVIVFNHETIQYQATMSQVIEGLVALQPPDRRATWYTGQCSITKHGEGTFYPADASEPMCGTWDSNEFIEYHHHHFQQPALDRHMAVHHAPDAGPAFERKFVSPPLSPRESLMAGEEEHPMHMSPRAKVAFKSDFDRMFADEVRIFIFGFLDVKSLCRAAQVCTEWRRLTNDPSLWCLIHMTRWGRPRADSRTVKTTKIGNNPLREGGIDWKESVRDQHLLERNWTKGRYFMQTLRGHSGWVTGVDLHTNKLVSCSYDGTVRIWNTQTGNSLQTLPGDLHGDDLYSPCWCVKFKGSQIMAGSSDSKVRQWDMNTAQLVRVFEGHAGGVKCLQFDDNLNQLTTGSDDKTVKLFDVRTGVCVQSVTCAEAVGDFQCQDNTLMTVLKRESDVFWFDLRMGSLVRQLSGHSKAVYCLQFDLNRKMLVTGGRDRKICIWDTDTCEPVRELTGHDYIVMSLQFDSHKIVSASADETIKIWDIKSGDCMQTLSGHTEVVMKVSMDPTKIVSGSADKTVIVWDFLRGQ